MGVSMRFSQPAHIHILYLPLIITVMHIISSSEVKNFVRYIVREKILEVNLILPVWPTRVIMAVMAGKGWANGDRDHRPPP